MAGAWNYLLSIGRLPAISIGCNHPSINPPPHTTQLLSIRNKCASLLCLLNLKQNLQNVELKQKEQLLNLYQVQHAVDNDFEEVFTTFPTVETIKRKICQLAQKKGDRGLKRAAQKCGRSECVGAGRNSDFAEVLPGNSCHRQCLFLWTFQNFFHLSLYKISTYKIYQ